MKVGQHYYSTIYKGQEPLELLMVFNPDPSQLSLHPHDIFITITISISRHLSVPTTAAKITHAEDLNDYKTLPLPLPKPRFLFT